MSLAVVDLGCGNLGSVAIAFERLGVASEVTSDPARIAAAERLVLPGVGAAGFAMSRIHELGLFETLRDPGRPLLGICLGMQLLFDSSEEGEVECLGLIPGQVRRLEAAPGRPVPHMGWSRLSLADPGFGLQDGDYVYFAHSYACDSGPATVAAAEYGREIPSLVASGHVTGAQFHPERSGPAGSRFLAAWLGS